jgi:hypothetical protein
MQPMSLYVAPDGKDDWSGMLPEPNAERSDGPLATIAGARNLVRKMRASALLTGPVTVFLRSGR